MATKFAGTTRPAVPPAKSAATPAPSAPPAVPPQVPKTATDPDGEVSLIIQCRQVGAARKVVLVTATRVGCDDVSPLHLKLKDLDLSKSTVREAIVRVVRRIHDQAR